MDDGFNLNTLLLKNFELILSVVAGEDNSLQIELYVHYTMLKLELFQRQGRIEDLKEAIKKGKQAIIETQEDKGGSKQAQRLRGEEAQGKKPWGNEALGERSPRGTKPQGNKALGERSPGGTKPWGNEALGEQSPGGIKPQGNKALGERSPRGMKPQGNEALGDYSPRGMGEASFANDRRGFRCPFQTPYKICLLGLSSKEPLDPRNSLLVALGFWEQSSKNPLKASRSQNQSPRILRLLGSFKS